MEKDILIERSEILSAFNAAEIADILKEQITSDLSNIVGIPMDYFKPLYYRYQNMMNNYEMTFDLREDLKNRFIEISMIFITQIEKVFQITVDTRWLDDHTRDIPCLALALYSFFVLEIQDNVEDALHSYIRKNSDSLYAMFEEYKTKRDASTLIYTKTLSPENAVIIANIYDVSTYVMETMTEEEFFANLQDGYVPGEIIGKLYENGYIVGDFMSVLSNLFSESSHLKSTVCFNIEASYRDLNGIKKSS